VVLTESVAAVVAIVKVLLLVFEDVTVPLKSEAVETRNV
jgi:hypothetical protein